MRSYFTFITLEEQNTKPRAKRESIRYKREHVANPLRNDSDSLSDSKSHYNPLTLLTEKRPSCQSPSTSICETNDFLDAS